MSLRLMRALAAAAVLATLPGFLSSCTLSGTAGGGAAARSSASVIKLNKIDTLKSLFNHDDGHTRLILIFSPT
jgi:hypothetical protein